MSDQLTLPTGDLAAEIIAAIDRQPGITVPEIAMKLGASASDVYRAMPGIAEAIVKVDRQFYPPGSEPQPDPTPAPSPTPPAVEPPAEPAQQAPVDPSATLIISHINEQGTLVEGTQRGDGSRDALRAAQFKWSRNLGAWYMPNSRGRAAKRARIEYLQTQLEQAGFTVKVEIEEYDAAQAFETLQTHGDERAALHAGRAAAEQARSDARYQASSEAVRGVEPGQPILAGHHSQPRHERDLARSHSQMGASVAHSRKAERAAGRAAEVERQTQRRSNPVVMGRRAERLEAEQRALERRLNGAGEAPRRRAELADIKAEITFLHQQMADSGVKQYTKADLQPGDLVQIRGSWREVAKTNTKTVAVKTGYSWTDKYPYYEITAHERPARSATAA
jgi:hypothetical protein